MRLGDMLHILRLEISIEIRDKYNVKICICDTNSKGVDPYVNYEVTEWFPAGSYYDTIGVDAVFLIDLEDNNE